MYIISACILFGWCLATIFLTHLQGALGHSPTISYSFRAATTRSSILRRGNGCGEQVSLCNLVNCCCLSLEGSWPLFWFLGWTSCHSEWLLWGVSWSWSAVWSAQLTEAHGGVSPPPWEHDVDSESSFQLECLAARDVWAGCCWGWSCVDLEPAEEALVPLLSPHGSSLWKYSSTWRSSVRGWMRWVHTISLCSQAMQAESTTIGLSPFRALSLCFFGHGLFIQDPVGAESRLTWAANSWCWSRSMHKMRTVVQLFII